MWTDLRQFASNLWQPSKPPGWWSPSLSSKVSSDAKEKWPLEAFGFFVLREEESGNPDWEAVFIQFAPVRARKSSFQMDPQQVIQTSYEMAGQKSVVAGTFHSHPQGGNSCMTDADRPLARWGAYHLLLVYDPENSAWQERWYTSRL